MAQISEPTAISYVDKKKRRKSRIGREHQLEYTEVFVWGESSHGQLGIDS